MKRYWSPSSSEPAVTSLDVTRPVVPGHGEVVCAPSISMAIRAYQKLFSYIRLFDEEIAGMGFVDELPGNHLRIADVFLVKQSGNTGVHVDITDGIHELMVQMAAKNEDPSRLALPRADAGQVESDRRRHRRKFWRRLSSFGGG